MAKMADCHYAFCHAISVSIQTILSFIIRYMAPAVGIEPTTN